MSDSGRSLPGLSESGHNLEARAPDISSKVFRMAKKKVVLAYSGGLDTTVIIKWLQENLDADVVAVCVNVGQAEDLGSHASRAGAMVVPNRRMIDTNTTFTNTLFFITCLLKKMVSHWKFLFIFYPFESYLIKYVNLELLLHRSKLY